MRYSSHFPFIVMMSRSPPLYSNLNLDHVWSFETSLNSWQSSFWRFWLSKISLRCEICIELDVTFESTSDYIRYLFGCTKEVFRMLELRHVTSIFFFYLSFKYRSLSSTLWKCLWCFVCRSTCRFRRSWQQYLGTLILCRLWLPVHHFVLIKVVAFEELLDTVAA